MGGSLVMRVVRGVRHHLRIHQPADEQEADGQANRNGSLKGSVHTRALPRILVGRGFPVKLRTGPAFLIDSGQN